MTSADKPIVFIVDDDDRMRAATQRLLKTVGSESPGDFHWAALNWLELKIYIHT